MKTEYIVRHVRHGCYEVLKKSDERTIYLTNFRNKKAAASFIEAYKKGKVEVDWSTAIPTPDFK